MLTLLTAVLPLPRSASDVPPLAGLIDARDPAGAGRAGRRGAGGARRPPTARAAAGAPCPSWSRSWCCSSWRRPAPPTSVAPLLVAVVLVAPLAPDVDKTGAMAFRIAGAVVLPFVIVAGLFLGMSILG